MAPATWLMAASDSCAAPEASSAPLAIWSAARLSSSAADADSLMPADNWLAALATRSAACCCLAMVWARLRLASASRDMLLVRPAATTVAGALGQQRGRGFSSPVTSGISSGRPGVTPALHLTPRLHQQGQCCWRLVAICGIVREARFLACKSGPQSRPRPGPSQAD